MSATLGAPTSSSPSAIASNAEDIDLVRRAAAGDTGAQRLMVSRLMRRVQRLCGSLARNREDANDASQASLITILRSARCFRGESSLERWADRIAVRTTLRQLRERRRDSLSLAGCPPQAVYLSADPAIAATEYLESLPEVQRLVLILRCGFEYSVEEIAELTHSSPNTVKDRLKRARVNVRRQLERETLKTSIAVATRRR